ncbi:hypothetical protein KTJ20_08010 [Acinetobacter ursingii]|uniref:hypothetical protein n=1 Tax=Acinetobacter ursingii TaxID=108980 RepID=UPI00148F1689|nr:hypothetical protein [Acinetobacter ursingii]MCU4588703.1 hypothetical protein [Acinetobacter ursingii]
MAKRFSPEFKQQAIDNALSNSHESLAVSTSPLLCPLPPKATGFPTMPIQL